MVGGRRESGLMGDVSLRCVETQVPLGGWGVTLTSRDTLGCLPPSLVFPESSVVTLNFYSKR